MILEKINGFLPVLILSLLLLFGAMYASFRSLTIKMSDILKDVSKGMEIREEILKSIMNIITSILSEEDLRLKDNIKVLDEQNKLKNPLDKVNYDEKLEEIVVLFLNLSKNYEELKENFKFVELSLRLKDLETRIINEKYRYNGIVGKYNFRRENAIGKFFSKLYRFDEKEKLYLSDEIVDILNK